MADKEDKKKKLRVLRGGRDKRAPQPRPDREAITKDIDQKLRAMTPEQRKAWLARNEKLRERAKRRFGRTHQEMLKLVEGPYGRTWFNKKALKRGLKAERKYGKFIGNQRAVDFATRQLDLLKGMVKERDAAVERGDIVGLPKNYFKKKKEKAAKKALKRRRVRARRNLKRSGAAAAIVGGAALFKAVRDRFKDKSEQKKREKKEGSQVARPRVRTP